MKNYNEPQNYPLDEFSEINYEELVFNIELNGVLPFSDIDDEWDWDILRDGGEYTFVCES